MAALAAKHIWQQGSGRLCLQDHHKLQNSCITNPALALHIPKAGSKSMPPTCAKYRSRHWVKENNVFTTCLEPAAFPLPKQIGVDRKQVVTSATEGSTEGTSEKVRVESGDTVSVHYRCVTSEGRLLHSSEAQEPLTFVSGAGNVVGNPLFQEFDQATRGLTVGEKGSVQAVGDEWTEELVFDVPREHEEIARLEESVAGTDEGPLRPGSVVQLINGNPAVIVAIDEEHVRIDANHPLAGSTLDFEVEVVNIEKTKTTVSSPVS